MEMKRDRVFVYFITRGQTAGSYPIAQGNHSKALEERGMLVQKPEGGVC
jgi:hypothetical protein